MAITAGAVVEAARDGHRSFTRERHPGNVLYRFLNRWQQRMVPKAVEANEALLMETETIGFPLADFAAGHVMPEHVHLHALGVAIQGQIEFPVQIMSWDDRHKRGLHFAVWLEDDTLFFVEDAIYWNGIEQVVLKYVAPPAPITVGSSPFTLPDEAEDAATAAVQQFMAGRSKPDDKVDKAYFAAVAGDAQADFLHTLRRRGRAKIGKIQCRW